MMNSNTLRRWLLASALVATVAAAGWVGSKEQNGIGAANGSDGAERAEAPRRQPAPANPAAGPAIDMEKLSQRPVARSFGEMFHSRNWQPPPPSPAAGRAAEAPRAPPLPFRFFGRLVEDGKTIVFLDRQDEIYAAKAGDTIAGSYRVEEINGTEVVLTYLPLKQRQRLPISSIE